MRVRGLVGTFYKYIRLKMGDKRNTLTDGW